MLIASVLATNAILHSRPRGESFMVRVQLRPDHLRVECYDSGGPWRSRRQDDRPHGLNIVEALAGPDSWGVETVSDGNRVVWARLTW